MTTPIEGGIWAYLSSGFSLGKDPQKSLVAMQKCLDEFCVANGLDTKAKILVNTPPASREEFYEPSFAITVNES